jgi:hypothetical protein
MRCCLPSRRMFSPALALVLVAASAPAVEGQLRRDFHSGMRTAIGYSGVLPDAVAGVGVWNMVAGPFGVFADAKMTPTSRRDHAMHCPPVLETCTVEYVESQYIHNIIRDDDEYMIFNVGGMYAITPEFMFMLGGGAARTRTVREYFDEAEEPITETGQYFVDHQAEPETELQLVAGMMIRAGDRIAFRFGYETAPGGMSLGGYFIVR